MQPVLSRLFHTIQVSNEDQRQEEEGSWGPPVVPLIKGQHWSPSVAVVIMPLGQLKLSHAKNRVMKNRTFSGLETSRGKGRHILKHSAWIKSPVLPCKSITVYIFCGLKFMFGSARDLKKKGGKSEKNNLLWVFKAWQTWRHANMERQAASLAAVRSCSSDLNTSQVKCIQIELCFPNHNNPAASRFNYSKEFM